MRNADFATAEYRRRLAYLIDRLSLALKPCVDRSAHEFAHRTIMSTRESPQTIKLRFWKQNLRLFHGYIDHQGRKWAFVCRECSEVCACSTALSPVAEQPPTA